MAYDEEGYTLWVTVKWTWDNDAGKWTYEVTGAKLSCGEVVLNDEGQIELTGYREGPDDTYWTQLFYNYWTKVDMTVRKYFTGVDALPENFSITITGPYVDMTLELDDATQGNGYYEWNIELPALKEDEIYTFAENGYAVSGTTHSLTVQFAKRKLPSGSWSYGSRTTVTGVSFNMVLNAGEYLNGTRLLEAAQVNLTNAYTATGGGTVIIPPDTTPTPDPTPDPEEEIDKDDVPLTDLPEEEVEEDIDEDDVPMAEAPETGDSLGMWIAAAGVSGLGLVWIALTGRKRKDEEDG